MKTLQSFLFIIALHFHAAAQTSIQVILKNTGGHKIDKADAFDLSQVEFYNYTYSDTLQLDFKKTTIDCYNIRYFENGKMFRQQLWLDTGKITIEAHLDSSKLIIDTVINSPTYYRYKDFTKQYALLYKTNDTTALNNFLLGACEANIDNPFALFVGNLYVGINQNIKANLITLKNLTDKQGEKFKWFFFYETVHERLQKILSITKINFADFSFTSKANKKTALPIQGADYYVLDLWFLACPPCVRDHKIMAARLTQLQQQKVAVIGISVDENITAWKGYLAKHKYNWPNYLEDRGHHFISYLSIPSYPTYIIVDGQGNIINSYNSFAAVLKKFGIKE